MSLLLRNVKGIIDQRKGLQRLARKGSEPKDSLNFRIKQSRASGLTNGQ